MKKKKKKKKPVDKGEKVRLPIVRLFYELYGKYELTNLIGSIRSLFLNLLWTTAFFENLRSASPKLSQLADTFGTPCVNI
jgi:hypothetical protein